jgi:hypothetical protein
MWYLYIIYVSINIVNTENPNSPPETDSIITAYPVLMLTTVGGGDSFLGAT